MRGGPRHPGAGRGGAGGGAGEAYDPESPAMYPMRGMGPPSGWNGGGGRGRGGPGGRMVGQQGGRFGGSRHFPSNDGGGYNRKHAPGRIVDVAKIPGPMNIPEKIYSHFSKFGNVTNIRVGLNSMGARDPEAAVVEYDDMDAAKRAVSSRDAVMRNRFILVKYGSEEATGSTEEVQNFASLRETFSGGTNRKKTAFKRLPTRILEVQNIPAKLNSIPKIFEHFIQFGEILHVRQIKDDQGRGEFTAHVEFETLEAAQRACGDASAILNNRFIRVVFGAEALAASETELEQFAAIIPALPGGKAKPKPVDEVASGLNSKTETSVNTSQGPSESSTNQANINEMMDLHNKQQAIVEEQLKQQKLLFAKIETVTGDERKEMMKTLLRLSKSIEENQQSAKAAFKAVTDAKSKQGVHRRSHEGFTSRGRGRGRVGRGRGRGRFYRYNPQGAVLDNRSKSLIVCSVPDVDSEEVIARMKAYGKLESTQIDQNASTVIVKFVRRGDAEQASSKFITPSGISLVPEWFEEPSQVTKENSGPDSTAEQPNTGVDEGTTSTQRTDEAIKTAPADTVTDEDLALLDEVDDVDGNVSA